MTLPTTLTRPKPIAFSITVGANPGPIAFEAWNIRTGEVIQKDKAGQWLKTNVAGKGSLDASWFVTSGWQTGDKIIISYAGKTYGSGSITLTASTSGSQKISAISAVTTALPAFNM